MSALSSFTKVLWAIVSFISSTVGTLVLALLRKMNPREPTRHLAKLQTRAGSVLRCKILWRRKVILTKPAAPDDFLLWSGSGLCPLDLLMARDVSLYSISPDVVLLVRTSPGVNCYRSQTSPFFYLAQFQHAEEVYVTTHRWLHQLASETAADRCPVQVTWLWNTGRCGSTMASQIMESVPGTVSYSEPDVIENVAAMANSQVISSEQMQALLRSAIDVLVYHAKIQTQTVPSAPNEACVGVNHVFIKPRAVCNMLIKDVHALDKEARHIFMYRNPKVVIQSFRELIEKILLFVVLVIDSDRVASMTPLFRQTWYKMLMFGSGQDRAVLEDLVPTLSTLGIIASKVCTHLRLVMDLQAEGLAIPALRYEDIVADPTNTVDSLLDYVHIPREHLDNALKSLDKTSQASVPKYTKNEQSYRHLITARERKEVEAILERLRLPKLDDEFVFSQQIGR